MKSHLTAMNTENLIVNDDRQSEEVEHVREICPDMGSSILPDALRVESIRLHSRMINYSSVTTAKLAHLSNSPRLMISSN